MKWPIPCLVDFDRGDASSLLLVAEAANQEACRSMKSMRNQETKLNQDATCTACVLVCVLNSATPHTLSPLLYEPGSMVCLCGARRLSLPPLPMLMCWMARPSIGRACECDASHLVTALVRARIHVVLVECVLLERGGCRSLHSPCWRVGLCPPSVGRAWECNTTHHVTATLHAFVLDDAPHRSGVRRAYRVRRVTPWDSSALSCQELGILYCACGRAVCWLIPRIGHSN